MSWWSPWLEMIHSPPKTWRTWDRRAPLGLKKYSAEKAWEHGQGYAAPSAQMFLHRVAQHTQFQNPLQPENKAKKISVCTICLDQSLSADFLQVFFPGSPIRVLLVALEEVWQENQLKILRMSQNDDGGLIKSSHYQHSPCKPGELRVLFADPTVLQGSKICQISQNGPHSPPRAHVHHQHSCLYAFHECDVKSQLRFSLPSSSRTVTLLRNQKGLAGHGGKMHLTDIGTSFFW